MSRAFVSVGFGRRYEPYVRRLERTVREHWDGEMMVWIGRMPSGSPSHDTHSYAFKLYALKEAVGRGHTTLLWSDACVIAERPIGPVFDEIEDRGYLFVKDGHRLREWASDAVLEWAGLSDRDALGETTVAAGGFVGLDLTQEIGETLWSEWWDAYRLGLTNTYVREHQRPENRAKSVAMHSGVHLSDRPDVLGSLGDEAVFGALCVKYGLERNTGDWCINSPGGYFRSTGYDGGKLGPL